ncbi:hypothetical protein [Bradyrhizobium sp. AUGA SZCCT0182]|uniref:hypothetical protein n=1 Tax=Bradyrhizobium sp. AUGA SZCCT0182 TaxID=2807667 RepID=UPI001BAC286E|nr:hypothetical protein [Bradyrhizobium sp. AUGA SZCCT0182]MBR1233140.1 hypothetical protein [Bradyrhizobium sp. AUGA SZCCT0182]
MKAWDTAAIAAIALLLASFGASAENSKIAVRAPIGCAAEQADCEQDISLAAASASANALSVRLSNCLVAEQKQKEEDKKREDEDIKKEEEEYQQLKKEAERKGESVIIPSLRFRHFSVLDGYVCKIFYRLNPRCSGEKLVGAKLSQWAPVQQIEDGAATIRNLQARAETGNAVDNQIVVEATESKPNEQHLAICGVRTINHAQGPPHDCTTVAIVTPNLTLMRADFVERFDTGGCLLSSTVRMSGAIDVTFEVNTKLEPTRFGDAIHRTLTEQLAFQCDTDIVKDNQGKVTAIFIRSTAPYRDSPILKNGWRESIDFDVNISVKDSGIDVRAFSKPMVARAAAGTAVEYRGPDDAQRATYARVLNDYIGKALKTPCTKAKDVDSKRIQCE